MSDASRIHLRDWREADLPALTRWRNDVDLQSQLLARVRGSSLDQVREWARKRSVAATSLLQVVAMCDGDRAIGYVQLVGLDDLDQCGDLGICLEPESQGAGLGRSAIVQFMTYVCKRRPIRKFELRALPHALIRVTKQGGEFGVGAAGKTGDEDFFRFRAQRALRGVLRIDPPERAQAKSASAIA